jgi:hypothetical protein
VRVLLEKVVLDFPDVIDAKAVGQLDLLESILQQSMLIVLRPGAGQLELVEDTEPH